MKALYFNITCRYQLYIVSDAVSNANLVIIHRMQKWKG